MEKAFNVAVSDSATRCCVCSLFDNPNLFQSFQPQLVSDTYKKLNKKFSNNGVAVRRNKSELFAVLPKPVTELRVVVQRVLVNLPSASSATEIPRSCVPDSGSDRDQLITCSSCGICVHRCEYMGFCIKHGCCFCLLVVNLACYGVPHYASVTHWLCQRCQAGVSHNQDCCLCLLRGGALKPTDGGRWAHLVCAVVIPDVSLGDVHNKEPVITEDITRARRKLVL